MEDDELLVRRKRVNEYGEWEFECRQCEQWLFQRSFKGCVEKIDAYGNCLICSACRIQNSNQKRINTLETDKNNILTALGYNVNGDKPVWQQFYDKHGFKY